MLSAQVDCYLAGWPSASPPLFFAESTMLPQAGAEPGLTEESPALAAT